MVNKKHTFNVKEVTTLFKNLMDMGNTFFSEKIDSKKLIKNIVCKKDPYTAFKLPLNNHNTTLLLTILLHY